MQLLSNHGQDESEKVKSEVEAILGEEVKVPSNPVEFQVFNFGHDVREESLKALKGLSSAGS